MRRLHLRDYLMALIAERGMTLNPRDRLDVNVRKFLGAAEEDFKVVLKEIGQNFGEHVVRMAGAVGQSVLGDLVEMFADGLRRK